MREVWLCAAVRPQQILSNVRVSVRYERKNEEGDFMNPPTAIKTLQLSDAQSDGL
jgi:hypothetical protein